MSMESRKLVEFYIDTDSESESRSSSEGERPEDEDDGDVVKLDEEESPVERSSSIPMLEESDSEMEYEEPVHLTSPPQDSVFQQDGDFKLYDEECSESSTPSPIEVVQPLSPDEQIKFDYPSPIPLHQEQPDREPSVLDLDPRLHKEKSVSPPRRCICGSSSPGLSSMIECHSCHGRFHGDCVGISRQKALLVRHFYCMVCMDKNPELVTEFESKAERGGEEFQHRARAYGGDAEGGVTGQGISHRGGRKKGVYKNRRGNRTCGSCTACLNFVDCRRCRFCKDLPKYGGPGKVRQKCIARQCLRRSKILYTEESLQAGRPVLQEDMAAELRALGISIPQINDPMFFIEDIGAEEGTDPAAAEGAKESQMLPDNYARPPPLKKRQPAGKRGRRPGGGGKGKLRSKAATKTRLDVEDIMKSASTRQRRAVGRLGGTGSLSREDFYTPTHCLGPGCIYEARPHSKYCSDECGIQLALGRIKKYLPAKEHLRDTETPLSTLWNDEKIRELEEEQKSIKEHMEELDNQTDAIDDHLIKIASLEPTEDEDVFDAESEDLTMHCPTCSQPVPLKKAMVHMERCYTKLEGMVSFGSIVKNEGTNIFCDKYDPSQKTYCKRLRVLCPEHTKEPKIGAKEICGCPLGPLFPATHKTCDSFCERPRKSCIRHYCWNKLRKAEIDQQKLNLFLKLEEVGEQIRLNQWQKSHRSSLLATMLHHTIKHTSSSSSSWNGIRTKEVESEDESEKDFGNMWESIR